HSRLPVEGAHTPRLESRRAAGGDAVRAQAARFGPGACGARGERLCRDTAPAVRTEGFAMTVIIVDYNAGNIRSVQRACAAAKVDASVSGDPDVVRKAPRVIFPGVGNAQSAMETLRERGLDEALTETLRAGRPVFGICVGA